VLLPTANAAETDGADEAQSAETTSIVINEVVYDDVVPDTKDSIELYNAGDTTVDLAGWSLHDDKDRTGKGTISGTLEPGEFVVYTQLEDGEGDFDFGLGKGDSVVLKNAEGTVVDQLDYKATASRADWSRCPDGTGDFAAATQLTLGAANICTSAESDSDDEAAQLLVINEIDSSPADWVELYNAGDSTIDLSGYEIRDNSDDHRWRFADGASIGAGEYVVVDAKTVGLVYNDQTGTFESGTFEAAIGIGSGDSIRLYSSTEDLLDSYSWSEHAALSGDAALATYARCPDGTGAFAVGEPTAGAANVCIAPSIAINEIESNGDAHDWAEIVNTGETAVDISGWTLIDNDPIGHASDTTPVAQGTILQPGEYFVFEGDTDFTFGLGKNDTVTIRDANGTTVAEYEYSGHAAGVLARCPDGTGDFTDTAVSTAGTTNSCGEALPDGGDTGESFPADGTATTQDLTATFLEDSSGLDWADGYLWAVDNGTGTFWKLVAHADGSVEFADGWENGKRARFQKDADDASAKGPDSEGITVDGDGLVYLAIERENSDKGTNYNVIMQLDPETSQSDVVASKEWDVTQLLPQVSANMGIEAIEWIPNSALNGKFYDANTGALFDSSTYEGIADGVFFVALEDNGHVYGFVLGNDGSAQLVADIDSGLGGAMGLNYLADEGTLYVESDDGYAGQVAAITFAGTSDPEITVYARPAGVANVNNEGFAISEECVAGTRAAWFFQDGVAEGALTSIQMDCTQEPEESASPTPTETSTATPTDNSTLTPTPSDSASPRVVADNKTTPLANAGIDVTGLLGIATVVLLIGGVAVYARRRESHTAQ
jgi:hypothetical protein